MDWIDDAKREPLTGYNAFRSSNLDEATNIFGSVFRPHKMRTLDRSKRVNARLDNLKVHGGLSINYAAYGAAVEVDVDPFDDFYLIVVPIRQRFELVYGSERIGTSPTLGACISALRPMKARLEADCQQLMVKIDRGQLERHYATHLSEVVKGLEFELTIDFTDAAGQHLYSVLELLCQQYKGRTSQLPSNGYSAQLRSILFNALIYSQPNNYREKLLLPTRTRSPLFIKRVKEYVAEHAADMLTVEELAEVACVSPRTLFSLFQAHCGVSPMVYVRSVRLERVRNELMRGGPGDGIVSRTALKWGFYHLGHFSAVYKRAFNESPSETLRLHR